MDIACQQTALISGLHNEALQVAEIPRPSTSSPPVAPSRYLHIALMSLMLPLAWLIRKEGGRILASVKDVAMFLPLWVACHAKETSKQTCF